MVVVVAVVAVAVFVAVTVPMVVTVIMIVIVATAAVAAAAATAASALSHEQLAGDELLDHALGVFADDAGDDADAGFSQHHDGALADAAGENQVEIFRDQSCRKCAGRVGWHLDGAAVEHRALIIEVEDRGMGGLAEVFGDLISGKRDGDSHEKPFARMKPGTQHDTASRHCLVLREVQNDG